MRRRAGVRVTLGALLVATALVGACRSSPQKAAPVFLKPPPPTAQSISALHYVIDSQRSSVLVLVYRDGPMGHLGHNHLIAVRGLSGRIEVGADPHSASFDMQFQVDKLSVDDAALRAAEGPDFQSTVDEAAVAGTREHMLGAALLNASQFPQIRLQSEQIRGGAEGLTALTRITVRDTVATVQIPMTLTRSDAQLTVSGEFDLTHSQLGLTPYSVALGALRVAERLHVRYALIAHRVP